MLVRVLSCFLIRQIEILRIQVVENLHQKIKALEEMLLQKEVRSNQTILKELLAEDFQELGSNGCLYSRKDVIDWLANSENNTGWSLNDFRIKILSADLVLAIYKTKDPQIDSSKGSVRSSIWKRHGVHWQMAFHQGTKIV